MNESKKRKNRYKRGEREAHKNKIQNEIKNIVEHAERIKTDLKGSTVIKAMSFS